MTDERKQSPHYIPELDPKNGAGASPGGTMAVLLLLGETWLILGLGGALAALGVFKSEWALEIRAGLVIVGVLLSAILIILFFRTNRPQS